MAVSHLRACRFDTYLAPARFATHLFVTVRQFPDVGVSLVLALAILLPVPRTVWLLLECGRDHLVSGSREIWSHAYFSAAAAADFVLLAYVR